MEKAEIINQLRKDILRLQGFKPLNTDVSGPDLGPIKNAFPNGIFPTGVIHEFVSEKAEGTAATFGFIGGLLAGLMRNEGVCMWVSMRRSLYPSALKMFGIEPDRVIFVDVQRQVDALWVMEQALKCEGLSAVIAEIPRMSFTASRRLQLAVEKSKVTGLIIRENTGSINTTACIARWRITSLPSKLEAGMPGVGFPRWYVELTRVRNGKSGSWETEWISQGFNVVTKPSVVAIPGEQHLKVG
jgi:protein ImuA